MVEAVIKDGHRWLEQLDRRDFVLGKLLLNFLLVAFESFILVEVKK